MGLDDLVKYCLRKTVGRTKLVAEIESMLITRSITFYGYEHMHLQLTPASNHS